MEFIWHNLLLEDVIDCYLLMWLIVTCWCDWSLLVDGIDRYLLMWLIVTCWCDWSLLVDVIIVVFCLNFHLNYIFIYVILLIAFFSNASKLGHFFHQLQQRSPRLVHRLLHSTCRTLKCRARQGWIGTLFETSTFGLHLPSSIYNILLRGWTNHTLQLQCKHFDLVFNFYLLCIVFISSSKTENVDEEKENDAEEEAEEDPCIRDYTSGRYSPALLQPEDLPPGVIIVDTDEDLIRLKFARKSVLTTGQAEVGGSMAFVFRDPNQLTVCRGAEDSAWVITCNW